MRAVLVVLLLGSTIAAGCLGGERNRDNPSQTPEPTAFPVYGKDLPFHSLASIEPFETISF
ncbi:MAG TPA: hypothetical protein VGB18_01705, partial [Candidatus Thermoplasmatota archaeon]